MATQAQITINAVAGSNTTLPLGTLVQLNNNGLGDETTYLWTILAQPEGPADVLSSTIIQAPTFTPTKEGSYLIRLVVNLGQPNEQTDQVIAAVRELETGDRIPAAGETTEVDPVDGWANTAVDRILQRVTRLEDNGIAVGSAGAAGLVAGDVLWVTGTTTIATGLPDERVVPVFTKALATDPLAMSSDLFVLQQGVDGSPAPGLGDLIRVVQFGLFGGIPYGVLPTVGDPIFVSDLGTLSLTPGTLERQLGNVVQAAGGTYSGWFDPASATQIGIAGGDLSGTYPNPDVVGLQGDPLAASVGDGFVKRNAANTAWESVPYGTGPNTVCEGNDPRIGAGGPPSGPAGGILGYTGSTYPNPNGLAAGTIPIKGTWTPAIPYPATQPMIIVGDQPPVGSVGYPLQITASKGGDAAPFVGPGNTGGAFTLTAGAGGDGGAGGPAGRGGAVQLLGGDAGAGNAVPLGGATPYGGDALVKGGTGTAERGGHATLQGGTGSAVTAGVGGAGSGGTAYVKGGTGGAGTVALPAAAGGAIQITGGTAGADGGAGGGNGGAVLVQGGTGTGTGGSAGNVTIAGGSSANTSDAGAVFVEGGQSTSAGNGGSAYLKGGLSTGAADAGAVFVTGGGYDPINAPAFAGTAGPAIMQGGAGNAQAGADAYVLGGDSVSGAGGNAALVGGTSSTSDGGDVAVAGGNSTTAGSGGIGGEARLTGGTGSAGTVGVPSGDGGPITVGGGEAGSNFGGGAGSGGNVAVYGGDGTAAGLSGRLYLSDYSDKGKARPSGMLGGGVEIWTTYGGNAAASIPGGSGGELEITLGKGGNANTGVGETAGAAGALTITAGKGGTANAAGAHAATVGGAVTITAGEGGDGNGATTAATGGAISITAGAGGAVAAGAGGRGGALDLTAGAGTGARPGGDVTITGGEGGPSVGTNGDVFVNGATDNNGGAAGSVIVRGGLSNISGTPGTATLRGGPSAAGGTGGSAFVYGGASLAAGGVGGQAVIDGGAGTVSNGTVEIGTVVAPGVNLGRSAHDVTTTGRNVETMVTHVPVAGTTIPVNSPSIDLTPAGNVTMTATPTIQTAGIAAGTVITLIGGNASNTVLQRESALPGSGLRLASPTQTLNQYDALMLIFDGTYWREVCFSNNS